MARTSGSLRVTVQGNAIDIDHDGDLLTAQAVVVGNQVQLWIDGNRHVFDLCLQSESGSAKKGAADDDGQIRSPMPGVVSEIRVTAGEAVTVGQTVAVIESMKLFIPIAATIDGAVASIERKPGDAVTAHQRLLTIAAADARAAQPREEAHSQ